MADMHTWALAPDGSEPDTDQAEPDEDFVYERRRDERELADKAGVA
jgi:hypothetical protein